MLVLMPLYHTRANQTEFTVIYSQKHVSKSGTNVSTISDSSPGYGGHENILLTKNKSAHYNEIAHARAQVKTAFTEFWVKSKILLGAEKYFEFHFRSQKCEQKCAQIWLQNCAVELQGYKF